MINITQSAKYQPSSNGSSIAFTLGSTPTPGNIIIAFCGYSAYTGDRTITPPSVDWNQIDKTYSLNAGLAVYWYEVQEGDGTNFSFTVSGAIDTHSGVIYEINDIDVDNPINQHSITTTSSQLTITTSNVTPSVLNTLALSSSATDAGSIGGAMGATVSVGHTLDQSAIPLYHSTFGSHKNSLTNDLVTPISNTFTFLKNSGGAVASMLLLNPIVETVNIEETIALDDEWQIQTNPEQQSIEETIALDDEWQIQVNPEQEQIEETITIDDSWNVSTIEYSYFASKIISYNPLIYVTNSLPAKIIKVDISDPENPVKYTYEIISNYYAKDVIFNSSNDYFYVICADGKIVKINKNDLEDQTIIDTLDTDVLLNVDAIDSSLLTFASTDDEDGEIIMLDEREVKKINTDIRWSQQIIKIISVQLNTILGKLVNLDLRWKAITSKIVNLDLRWLKSSYDDIFKFPTSYTDWEVYINGTELTVLDDVDMNSIFIMHDIIQEEEKASQAQFTLNRRHDKLNYTNNEIASEITNNNIVIIKIKGNTEFTGKISNLTCNSETETVNVIATGSRPIDKRHSVNIPMSGLNEQLHLYHCLINNINIDNPYINPNDENPGYYKGIQVDLGIEIEQNILRYSSFTNVTTLAESIENGEFTPKQNWNYFWFARFENFITGRIQATLSYLGTSLCSLSTDTWKINGCSYKYQKQLDDTEIELGIYQVGSAPYDEISVKNGKKITKDKWVDKNDGLYLIKDEGYDYTEYAKIVAELEYQKLLNINGQILPKTSAEINLSIDAYYYYNIGLLTRINVTNTTTSNIYNNQNGFPVSVKNIRIQCSTEGENSMIVTLSCDNAKSQLELEEIDAQYPDENSDEYIFEEQSTKQNSKFDPNTWSYLS